MCEFVKELGKELEKNIPEPDNLIEDIHERVPIPEPTPTHMVESVPTTVSTYTQTGGYPKSAMVQKHVTFHHEHMIPTFKFSLNTVYFLLALVGVGLIAYIQSKKMK